MPTSSSFSRALTEAAPGLSRRFFRCTNRTPQCHLWTPRAQQTTSCKPNVPLSHNISKATQARRFTTDSTIRAHGWPVKSSSSSRTQTQSTWQNSCRWRTTRAFSGTARSRSAAVEADTLAHTQSGGSKSGNKGFFPDHSSNAVAYWLLGSAASVFGIVIFGGLTRLTESGLSITEWRPVTGSLPPRTQADWESEFEKYRASPEFKILNSRMTLEEFKSIYWMEWIHRLWGRFVGLSFVVPAVYFVATKRVSKPMALRLFGIAGLIGFQGFLGWWMVKSGLKDDLFAPGSHPRVSQYRLTAHLGAAFVCYLAMLWNGLDILRGNKLLSSPTSTAKASLDILRHPRLRGFRVAVAGLSALVFVTAMSGGLVAGLDAGLIYNEFPYMGLGLTPPRSELFDAFYSHTPDHSDLIWRNFLENPSLVQLDHRILATATFSAVMALWYWSRSSANLKALLPRAAKRGVHGVVGFAMLQVTLGICTLLWLVPTHLASAHQAGALALLTWTVVLGSRTWLPSKAVQKLVAQRILAAQSSSSTAAAYTITNVARTAVAGAETGVSSGAASTATSLAAAGGLVGLIPLGVVLGGTAQEQRSTSNSSHKQNGPVSGENALAEQKRRFLAVQRGVR